jgi:hypothetical protein
MHRICCGALALLLAGPASAGAGEEAEPKPKPEPKPAAEQPAKGEKTEKKPKKKKPTNFMKVVADCISGEIPVAPSKKDGLEDWKGWKVANWGDPALCRQFKIKKTQRTMMYFAAGGGRKGKVATELPTRLMLAEKGAIKLHVYSRSDTKVKVAVALVLGMRGAYYETPAREVEAGKWRELSFDLAAKDYKAQATKWAHKAALGKERRLGRLVLLLYHGGKWCRILVDGFTVDAKPITRRPPKKEEPKKEEPKKEEPEKAEAKEGEKKPESKEEKAPPKKEEKEPE